MKYDDGKYNKFYIQQEEGETARILNPLDINVPRGYSIDVFAEGLDAPIDMLFINDTDILIVDSGLTSGNGKVMLLREGNISIIIHSISLVISVIYILQSLEYLVYHIEKIHIFM